MSNRPNYTADLGTKHEHVQNIHPRRIQYRSQISIVFSTPDFVRTLHVLNRVVFSRFRGGSSGFFSRRKSGLGKSCHRGKLSATTARLTNFLVGVFAGIFAARELARARLPPLARNAKARLFLKYRRPSINNVRRYVPDVPELFPDGCRLLLNCSVVI